MSIRFVFLRVRRRRRRRQQTLFLVLFGSSILISSLLVQSWTSITVSFSRRTSRTSSAVRLALDSSVMCTASSSSIHPAIESNVIHTETESHDLEKIPNWRVLPCEFLSEKEDLRVQQIVSSRRPGWDDAARQDSLRLYHSLQDCQDSYVAGPIQTALNTLSHAYRLYGPESVVCSFNGGKDAVVILHLLRAVHAKYYEDLGSVSVDGKELNENNTTLSSSSQQPPVVRPRAIYFDQKDEFEEVSSFVRSAVQEYDLDMIAFEQGVKFSEGLQVLVQNNFLQDSPTSVSRPYPLAFCLGTRTSDPNAGKQGHFAPSSHYMPPFMRVNPVLDWTYGHVWHFLRLFKLPYCSLYDQGYTSLGNKKDTLPCPALAIVGSVNTTLTAADASNSSVGVTSHLPRYWPAYMLRDWDQERAGRVSKTKKKDAKKKPQEQSFYAASESNYSSTGCLSMLSEARANPRVSTVPSNQQQQSNIRQLNYSSCLSFDDDTVTQRSVGLLIIGDEILKGYIADVNTHTAAKVLFEQNVLLKRVSVVSDDLDEICQEIRRLDQLVDVIITSGGVGPTHDDVTIKGVAAALECDMVIHEEMAQLLRVKMKSQTEPKQNKESETKLKQTKGNETSSNFDDLTEAQIKMSTLPSSSRLRYLSDNENDWPVLQCRNIFILPGVPDFFVKKIENVAKYLSCQLERSAAYKVVLSVDENLIVPILNEVVENNPNVSIGSYPFVSHPDFQTVITVEGRLGALLQNSVDSVDFEHDMIDQSKETMDKYVEIALDELITKLPKGSVLRVDNDDIWF